MVRRCPVALLAALLLSGSVVAGENEPLEGWHAKNYYGFHQESVPDLWDELCDVYGDGELDDVFADEHGLWSWGYPLGYSIGAACTQDWPFGPEPRCCLTPLHYRAAAPTAFAGRTAEPAGISWYRAGSAPAVHMPVPAVP